MRRVNEQGKRGILGGALGGEEHSAIRTRERRRRVARQKCRRLDGITNVPCGDAQPPVSNGRVDDRP